MDLKTGIMRALLLAQEQSGSPMLAIAALVRNLGAPQERIDNACRELEIERVLVCTPVIGPVELACLTITGTRRGRQLR